MTYNSFHNLIHYYSEMSAMGDRDPEFQLFGPTPNSASLETPWGRIANVSVPFAVLQALDDPLVGWRTLATNDLQGLVESGSGNVVLVLTKSGGHVVSIHVSSTFCANHVNPQLLCFYRRAGRWATIQRNHRGNG